MSSHASPHARVLILSAAVGEGHAAAARALAATLGKGANCPEVSIVDGVAPLGRCFRWCVERGYRWELRAAPGTYGLLYNVASKYAPARAVARALIVFAGSRRLARVIGDHQPDVVVSTYPATTAVLGALRRSGRITVPACAVITDFAGLSFWVDRGIDTHLVMYDESEHEVAARVGSARVTRVSPLVDAAFLERDPTFGASVRFLDLAPEARLVVVSGGGWAVGNLETAVEVALGFADVHVVCLAGRDEDVRLGLTTTFKENRRVTVLGFTDRMSDLLGAADALVHTTAGMTCLEALARGKPVVAFDAPPGHPRLNARRMAEAGLVGLAEHPEELGPALGRALSIEGEAPRRDDGADPAHTVLSLEAATPVASRWAPIAARAMTAASVAGFAAAGTGVLGEGDLRGPALAGAAILMATTLRTAVGSFKLA